MLKLSCLPFILITMVVIFPAHARADFEIVFRAYAHAVLQPEKFDDYARSELSPHSDEFFDCLADVQESLVESYQDAVAHCGTLPPQYQDGCYQTDFGMMSGSLSTIAAVVRGKASWPRTIYGVSAITGKNFLGDFYLNIQRAALEIYYPALTCKSWWQFWK